MDKELLLEELLEKSYERYVDFFDKHYLVNYVYNNIICEGDLYPGEKDIDVIIKNTSLRQDFLTFGVNDIIDVVDKINKCCVNLFNGIPTQNNFKVIIDNDDTFTPLHI